MIFKRLQNLLFPKRAIRLQKKQERAAIIGSRVEEKYSLHKQVLKANVEGVADVIEQGANLNQLDDMGNSPLHWAVLGGYADIVELLPGAGANPSIISSDGYTPKWSACDFGITEIENILTTYGGKVLTDNNFDRISWSVFKGAWGSLCHKRMTLLNNNITISIR